MTTEGYRVLEAVDWTERRRANDGAVPLRAIATAALGGDAERADLVLGDLGRRGFVASTTHGWHWGYLTPQGRSARIVAAS